MPRACRTTPARDFSDGDDVASLMRAIAKDPTAIPAITAALSHREWEVRQWAARALGDQGPKAKSAVPALKAALSDSDARVREAAEIALGRVVPKR